MPEQERRENPRLKVQKGIVALSIDDEIQTGKVLDLNLTGISPLCLIRLLKLTVRISALMS